MTNPKNAVVSNPDALAILNEMQATLRELLKLQQANRADNVRGGFSEFMPLKDAAEFLGIKSSTLYKYLSEGKLKRYKKGERVFLKRTELEAWSGLNAKMI